MTDSRRVNNRTCGKGKGEARQLIGGSRTYNNFTVSNAAVNYQNVLITSGANTFNNVTLTNVRNLSLPSSLTQTINGTLTWDGTSTSYGILNLPQGATLALNGSGASTVSYLVIAGITFTRTGSATLTANNSINAGNNTLGSVATISAPAGRGYFIGG